jgi:hypothetical protein
MNNVLQQQHEPADQMNMNIVVEHSPPCHKSIRALPFVEKIYLPWRRISTSRIFIGFLTRNGSLKPPRPGSEFEFPLSTFFRTSRPTAKTQQKLRSSHRHRLGTPTFQSIFIQYTFRRNNYSFPVMPLTMTRTVATNFPYTVDDGK